jgi:hypothetical protein
MNVDVIRVPKEQAIEQLEKYKHIQAEKRIKEDTEMRRMWKAATEYPLLNVATALKEAGRNEQGHPLLALARADWKTLFWSRWENGFSSSQRYWTKKYAIKLPSDTYPNDKLTRAVTSVPFIPPDLRPDDALSKYHILFEVKEWKSYPTDPFLLKQVSGWIFAVIGEWDLTPLEAILLSSLRVDQ